jgi:glyoxylase-like metal-dependent hydrolase (beta-lactamase superfamily II)
MRRDVDDQYAPLADKIQAALKNLGITDKPVRFVINTRYHGDHTGGNAPKNNVVHMGDDFVRYGFPHIDVASGGSALGMIAAMEKVSARLPADVKVIPESGDVSRLDDVRELQGFSET